MVLIELLARPVFLIFGLLASMAIMVPFMKFFSGTFFNAMDTITADTVAGVVTLCMTVISRS